MKKFLAVSSAALLISTSSYATGLFVGADALYVSSIYRAKAPAGATTGSSNAAVERDNRVGYGLNAGARFDVLNLLGSVEVFYDQLNTQPARFESSTSTGDKVSFDNRYGAKLNVGFAPVPTVTPFLTVGLSKVRYGVDSTAGAYNKSEYNMLYGLGILFDLPASVTLKIAADYQPLRIRATQGGGKIESHLATARVGLIYNF